MPRLLIFPLLALAACTPAQIGGQPPCTDVPLESAGEVLAHEQFVDRGGVLEWGGRLVFQRIRMGIDFVIDEEGCPREFETVRTTNVALAESAKRSIRQQRFPVQWLDGVPVAVRVEIPARVRASGRLGDS
jgi:hypothetical protein